MIYRLDGISIAAYGASPIRTGEAFGLRGMFDLPARIGATEYDWGTSIEPYVEEEDIKIDGRTLTLHLVVKPESIDALIQACLQCVKLSTTYEIYDVVCREEIEVRNIGDHCLVIAKFWQNEYLLEPMSTIPSSSGSFRLDNFDLIKDFGIYVGESINLSNTAKRIEIPTTEFYQRTNHRGSRDIILNCFMKRSSVSGIHDGMKNFHALLMSPGMRSFETSNKTLSVYFKNGLTATAIKENILRFNLIATVSDNNIP